MKNLVQRLMIAGIAAGLAAGVSNCNKEIKPQGDNPYILEACSKTPEPNTTFVKLPADQDYNQIKWDRSYTQATIEGKDEIFLFYLRFELDCKSGNTDNQKVIRVLTSDELKSLNLATRTELYDYLKDRSKHNEGYIGPNILL